MKENLDVLVVTDVNVNNEQELTVLNSIINRVSKSDVNWKNHSFQVLSDEHIEELINENYSKQKFVDMFKIVKDDFEINKLLIYAEKTNPELYQKLKQGQDLTESLWQSYERNSKNGFKYNPNYLFLQKIFKEQGYHNVIEILFHHRMVDLTFEDADKKIPYHFIGRGFVLEGVNFPIWNPQGKDTGKKAIVLPITNVNYLSLEDQISYAKEIFNHEVCHAFLKLKDHSADDVDPEDCIMSVAVSREETIRLAKQNRGFKFCRNCDAVYKNSDLYKNK